MEVYWEQSFFFSNESFIYGRRRRYGIFQWPPLVGLGLRKEPPDSLLLDIARLYRVCFTGIAVF